MFYSLFVWLKHYMCTASTSVLICPCSIELHPGLRREPSPPENQYITEPHFMFFSHPNRSCHSGEIITRETHWCWNTSVPSKVITGLFRHFIRVYCWYNKLSIRRPIADGVKKQISSDTVNASLSEAICKHNELKDLFLKVMYLTDGCNWERLFQCYTGPTNADVEEKVLMFMCA